MLNKLDLEALIISLRRELVNFEQAILALERMETAKAGKVNISTGRASGQLNEGGVGKLWAKHRARTE